jgi:hypothetical protein
LGIVFDKRVQENVQKSVQNKAQESVQERNSKKMADVRYEISSHAMERYIERYPEENTVNIRDFILKKVKEGNVVLDEDKHRYIRNGDLFFPCIKWEERGKNVYNVKSFLTWEMVSHKFQTTR